MRIALLLAAALSAAFISGQDAALSAALVVVGPAPPPPSTSGPPIAAPATDKTEYRRPTSVPYPSDNPFTVAKAELGKSLYFDPRLSRAGSQSCATCHNPGFGWGDGLAVGVGDNMKSLPRRSPTILNAAFGEVFMWDGRADSLEKQALGPIESAGEMNMPIAEVVARLNAISGYKPLFEAAFPGEPITGPVIGRAIAAYERTVISGRAPFDAWVDGDEKAISEGAKRGFALFNGKGGCSKCHSGWNFTDDSFHDLGLPDKDIGRGKFLPTIPKAQQAFKTPGLREISHRAPYMHDGSIATLAAVVQHYDDGGIARPSRSDLIRPLGLSSQEKADLVVFMQTLNSETRPETLPTLPR
jgi:cytochrome c peroxidase